MVNDLEQARLDDPEGEICSYCGSLNDFADDCGWFILHPDAQPGTYDEKGYYINDSGPAGYTCESCWKGEPGRKHIAFYGLGER